MTSSNSTHLLLPGEHVVSQSEGNALTLTNKRVWYDQQAAGQSEYVSITLDSVASCGVTTRSYPVAMILALVAFVCSFVVNDDVQRYFLIACGVVLVITYFATRSAVLKITSDGGEPIVVPTTGMGRDVILAFLNSVDEQKLLSLEHNSTAGGNQRETPQ